MLKINIHTHAHFKELGDISAVKREILSDEIDYYVVAALDLHLHDGRTPEDIKKIRESGNRFSAHFYRFQDDTNENVARLREKLGARIIPFAYIDPCRTVQRNERGIQERQYKRS